MSKTMIRSLMVIFIIIILFAIVWLVYDVLKEQPADTNVTDTNLIDENTGLDNIINELFDNVIINEVIEQNIISNKESANNNIDKEEEEKEEAQTPVQSVTSKEEKAVNLVKKEWGSTDGVYFSNMGIDSQGRYIVSVNDMGSTKTLAFFVVDIYKELVTKQ